MPFVIELRVFATSSLPSPSQYLSSLPSYLAEQQPTSWAAGKLETGEAVLLVDGVDEFPAERRNELRDWIESICEAYRGIHVVVTSRPPATPMAWLRSANFVTCELNPMRRRDIGLFVSQWHSAVRLNIAGEDGDVEARVDRFRTSLMSNLERNRALRVLATNPLMCAMLCALNWDRSSQLPVGRIDVYRAALEMLLTRRDYERRVPETFDISLSLADRLEILKELAWWFTENGYSDTGEARVLKQIERALRSMPNVTIGPDAVLTFLVERSGVVRRPAPGRIDFIHKSFQEYLAASHYVDTDRLDALIKNVQEPSLREVVINAAGVARRAEGEQLIRGILQATNTSRSSSEKLHLRLLAAGCLAVRTHASRELVESVKREIGSLIPPSNHSEAKALASLGPDVIELLPVRGEELSPESVGACIYTAALVGGHDSLTYVSRFSSDKRPTVCQERIRAWSYFDPTGFARVAFSADAGPWDIVVDDLQVLRGVKSVPNLGAVQVSIQGPLHADTIAGTIGIENITELNLSGNPLLDNLRFVRRVYHLEKMVLKDCSTLRKISSLSSASKTLKHLEIVNCPAFVTRDIVNDFTRLEVLRLKISTPPDMRYAEKSHPMLREIVVSSS